MSQLPIRSLRLRSFATSELDRLTGDRGEIYYDREQRTLKVYNGPGQSPSTISVGGSSTLINGTKTVTLDSSGNLNLPAGGDLRNSSGQGVFAALANYATTTLLANTLTNYVTGASLGSTLNSYVLQNTGATGNIFTNLIDSADSSAITVTPAVIFSSDVTVENELLAKNIVNGGQRWLFGTDGTTGFPNSTLLTASSLSITTNHAATDQTWLFDAAGSLTLPGGATLKDSNNALALGLNAGNTAQGATAVAIGIGAGGNTQGGGAVAIGYIAGLTQQGNNAVAIGIQAGNISQGNNAIAIGTYPADSAQGANAIAIGFTAGYTSQGTNAIAIGNSAGVNSQANNSIIINASGSPLNQTTANTFTVAPIRNVTGASGLLQYNLTTKEVSYSSDIVSEGNINIEINLADSTRRIWQFGEDGQLTFPDGGNLRVSAVPATSIGAAGDTAGMLAFNASYAYYCTANYDGVTNIWRRTAHDVATW